MKILRSMTAILLVITILISNSNAVIIYSNERINNEIVKASEVDDLTNDKQCVTNVEECIIRENTTWTKEQSPYSINGKIQVAYGTTLKIEPGVVIYGNENNIEIYGKLVADASGGDSIKINNLNIKGSSQSNEIYELDMKNVDMNGGSLLSSGGNSGHGKISIKDSRFSNLEDYTYIWYPQGEVNIIGNIFSNCKKISIGSDYNSYIKNNVFYNTNDECVIESWANYKGSKTYVENNTFYDEGIVLKNKYDTSNIVGINNYWNTMDNEIIKSRLYDNNLDLSTPNIIQVEPILDEPHTQTPKFTPDIILEFNELNLEEGFLRGVTNINSTISIYDNKTNQFINKCTSDNTGEFLCELKNIDNINAIKIKAIDVDKTRTRVLYINKSVDSKPSEGTDINEGIIREDMTWSKDGSPYKIKGKVQVAYGTTISVEPGTVIEGNGNTLQMYGTLVADASDEDSIEINNLNIKGSSGSGQVYKLDINNVCMSGGSLIPAGDSGHGVISIKNSRFINLEDYTYIWYPQGEVNIIGNTFTNCKKISIGSDYNSYIKNNVFYSINDECVIESWANYKGSKTYVEYNTFYNEGIVLKNKYSTSNIVGTNNYWNTEDISIIQKRIKDNLTDLSTPNVIEFKPILKQSDLNTPKFSKPTIMAEDKIIKARDEFDAKSIAKAFDEEDGDITSKIKIVENTVDINKAGEYKVVYSVIDSHGVSTTKTIKVTVRSNEKPTISAKDVVIKVGDIFDAKVGVSASDKEDGDITSSIKLTENKVDTSKAGTYKVVYEVTDRDGNKAIKEIKVTVNPKLSIINNAPKITAKDIVLKVGDKFDVMSGVSASDKEDGNITSSIKVTENKVDTTKVGEYKVVYKVTDSQGASDTKTIKVTVRSNEKPEISAKDVVLKVGDKFDVMSGVSASDEEDGDITSSIKAVENTVDITKAGTYKVVYEVTDSDGNKVSKIIQVTVKLKVVSNVKATASTYNSNKITWSKLNDADGYEIYRATGKTGTYKLVKTITDGSTVSYTNTSLATGSTYYYKVRAYRTVDGKKVYGDFSSVSYAKPVLSIPTTVKAVSASYNSNKITWNKVTGASGYEIYRATSKTGSYKLVKTINSGSIVSYTNTSLKTGSTYYYKIRAYRTVDRKKVYSGYSAITSAKPALKTPSITLTAGSKKATAKWSKVSGANGYEIYRATSKTGKYSKTKTITKNSTVSYTNTSLTKGKTYYYKVRAYRTVNGKRVYSSYSSIKSIKVK